jgi:hypothetical protein
MVTLMLPITIWANVSFKSGKTVIVVIDNKEEQVVRTALEMFQQDYKSVFGAIVQPSTQKGTIYIGTLGLNSTAESMVESADIQSIKEHKEAFLIKVIGNKLVVLGSDKRGTAYGILEISRKIGVSPWAWWADSHTYKKDIMELEDGYKDIQYPSVSRRGIFINDEDWGLTPWSYQTYEPSDIKGQIGPKTHARIFELLLRLRANTFWPAMHSCSVAFYQTPGNKEMADKYGIFVGTSHCEPMVCNANAEWKIEGEGQYNYISNRANVLKFWEQRVTELANSDNIYTLGMRGIHDGPMEGAKTALEQKEALTKIINDQRKMLASIVNPNLEEISQVFIPYKEVLEAYRMGLEIPDDVTLMWTDDNYGYIRHFPDSTERARKGGNGIYYHVSYWGRPHDYLWLATTHPAHVYTQMKMAYDKGIQDMWILNVGDIKPAEYLIELYMDMAWNINAIEPDIKGLDSHLKTWLEREFGKDNSSTLLDVMNEYYRLAYIRKPEFMGNTRTEEKDPKYIIVSDLPWSESDIKTRIKEYEAISEKVQNMASEIPTPLKSTWLQFIEYPVRGAVEMNKKQLYGQLARHGLDDWQLSDDVYDRIVSLTKKYNALNNGKWNRIMDFRPRELAVFDKVEHKTVENKLPVHTKPLYLLNGEDYNSYDGQKPLQFGLGYQRGAVHLEKGSSVTYLFEIQNNDTISIELALAPNHPVDSDSIRFAISLNNGEETIIDYSTKGRSEEWKLNVLRNQAIRNMRYPIAQKGEQSLRIRALDEGVILDHIEIK